MCVLFDKNNFSIGKNKHDNWKIIDEAQPYHLWFHVSDYPSAHCIYALSSENTKISQKIIKQLAYACKVATPKCPQTKKIKITYTPVSNLIKGKEVGSVYFENEEKCKYVWT